MKNIVFLAVALVWLGLVAAAQQPAKPLYVLEDSYLKWRLLPSEQAYLSIDGKHRDFATVQGSRPSSVLGAHHGN